MNTEFRDSGDDKDDFDDIIERGIILQQGGAEFAESIHAAERAFDMPTGGRLLAIRSLGWASLAFVAKGTGEFVDGGLDLRDFTIAAFIASAAVFIHENPDFDWTSII